MKYEFHAHFPFALQDSLTQSAAIDFLARKRTHPPHAWPELAAVEDDGACMTLLAQTLVTSYKEQARVGVRSDLGGYAFWLEHGAREFLARQRRWLDGLNLDQSRHSMPDLSLLPTGTFALHFTFTLASPYLSKDDVALHLLDNPVKKEWVFKLPYIASTQWKGALQATMVRQLVEWWQNLDQGQQQQRKQFVAQRVQLTRLFGTEIENVQQYLAQCGDEKLNKWHKRYVRRFLSNTGFLAGRLYFYPTFFDQLSLEVINPHNRETGAGSLPIYFEAVPSGASGSFTLLYTPLAGIGQSETEIRKQVFADLQLVAQALEALFTVYGFGAKTSSGFGLADGAVRDGVIVVGGLAYESEAPTPETVSSAPPQPDLPRYLVAPDRLHPDFVSEAGNFKSEVEYQKLIEGRGQKYAKRDGQLYAKAKGWWEREGEQLPQQRAAKSEIEPQPAPEMPFSYPLARETFDTFTDLPTKAQRVANALRRTGEVT